MRKVHYFIHGFILSIGSAILVFAQYPGARIYFPPSEVLPLVITILLFYTLFLLISLLITRDLSPACLIASLFVLGSFYTWTSFLLITGCALLGLATLFLIIRKVSLENTHLIFNTISVLVIGYFSIPFIQKIIKPAIQQEIPLLAQVIPDEVTKARPSTTPDIYYIILDGYGQTAMLETLHDYDNTSFIRELQERGFFTGLRSKSNYPRTVLSLASSLNMQYLDQTTEILGDSELWWPLSDLIQESQVQLFLEEQGYTFISIASGWDFTNQRQADLYLKPYGILLNNLQDHFFSRSNLAFLGKIEQPFISFPSFATLRNIITYAYQIMPEISSMQGPKFIIAHILAPHPPFVFNADGDPAFPDYPFTLTDGPELFKNLDAYRAGYFSELEFINQQTLSMIDAILSQTGTEPVIIIQSDHGPGMLGKYDLLESTCIYERFSILNAFYFPAATYETIPEDISPVNTFRLLFNQFFDTDLAILPDKQFYSSAEHQYRFIDVSREVDTCYPLDP